MLATGDPDPCTLLEWDTQFFGVIIARVKGNSLTGDHAQVIENWCRQHQVQCLYFLARSDDAQTTRVAEDWGYRLVDIRMTLVLPHSQRAPRAENFPLANLIIRASRDRDVPALQRIARESYHLSRYYFDPNFPDQLCDALYETWITKSCNGYANAVLVAEHNDAAVGFISCHLDKPYSGSIGLIGVSQDLQSSGIGKALLARALEWFFAHDVRQIYVTTQGRNVAAQRLYQRHGFVTHAVELWYHKWY